MPVYEYKCEGCGHEFDRFKASHRKREEPTKEPCPKCEEERVENKLSTGIGVGDTIRMGHKKPDRGFRDRLNEINKAHPLGGMKNRYS